MELPTRPNRGRSTLISGVLCAAALLGVTASSAQARVESTHATDQVQRWASHKSFNEPYAYVDVIHDGARLDRVALNRCKGQYADKSLTVQISTCGSRWHVRAAYVSLHGRKQHFRIVYMPRDYPGRANYRLAD
jgi:hypothetical protein